MGLRVSMLRQGRDRRGPDGHQHRATPMRIGTMAAKAPGKGPQQQCARQPAATATTPSRRARPR